ncbi:ferredoxin reductase-like protein [Sistotremastrum niveocremeum HHB9708]|uniref:Ferredoxin reductase-like protein n=2 Tax=Sistotremastraceae TaxID=3402574 RepID=A0A164ZIT0_9AGAM|nr:ferredoxin reductase-like protein [Sistotremastrum niveocremeum HHB9708]KZT42876.1 ferredoxin reductase-like protein [Sistotremastrum suecicum HHB10207 ss-3]
MHPSHFTPTIISSSTPSPSDPTSKFIELKIPLSLLPPDYQDLSAVWSLCIKDDDIQTERPYTPLDGIDKNGKVRLWIRRYPDGEVGRWIHNKTVGKKLEIRGPLQTIDMKAENGKWDHIIMISGGTGITPFYQLMHQVFSGNKPGSGFENTRFTLLHSSRTYSQLPPRPILGPLSYWADRYKDRFAMKLFVDSAEDMGSSNVHRVTVRRIARGDVEAAALIMGENKSEKGIIERIRPAQKDVVGQLDRTLVLVCGPDPMVAAIAGPRARDLSQGPVRGILGDLGFDNSSVKKL